MKCVTKEGSCGSGLTDRQRRFVVEYLIDLNATKAAVRARYSPATAPQHASRLLSNVKVATAIAKQGRARNARLQMTADQVLERLVEEIEADMADLFYPDGTLRPICDWPRVWRKGLISGLQISETVDASGVRVTVAKIRFSDRSKRLDQIGRHIRVNAFRETTKHELSDPLAELIRQIQGKSIRPSEADG
jgi:phage terminase small subunit